MRPGIPKVNIKIQGQRVCLLLSGPPIGGFRSFVSNLASFLESNGFLVELCFLGNEVWAWRKDAVVYSINDCANMSEVCAKKPGFLFLLRINLECFIKRAVNHFFPNRKRKFSAALACLQKGAAKRVLKERKVFDFSDYSCVISTEEVYCNYFLSHNIISKKKVGFIHPDYSRAHFSAAIDYPFIKKLDATCAVSVSGRNSMVKAFPFLRGKIYGFRTPIDVDSILSRSNELFPSLNDDCSPDFVTVCRLDNFSKALDRLIMLARKLKDDGFRFVWVIIGDGSYRNIMKGQIDQFGLSSYVKMLGYMGNPLPLVRRAKLFVLQSYYEGYPLSVCEALVLNVPALITDFPSSSELVADGVTGFIARNDFESIYSKLAYSLLHPAYIERMHLQLSLVDKSMYKTCDALLDLLNGPNPKS